MLASRNIVFTPRARCLTSLCIISIFFSSKQSGSQDPKIRVSYNDRVRKGLIADFDRIRPADQCQVVCRVELWYRLRVKGVFLYVTP